MKHLEHMDEIDEWTPESIHRPGRDNVEVFPSNVLKHRVQLRGALSALGARDAAVNKLLDHLPAQSLCRLMQFTQLIFDDCLSIETRACESDQQNPPQPHESS